MNSKIEKQEFDQYLREARSWETDKVIALEKSKQLAWRVASAAGMIAGGAVFAVAMLTPLKTTEPYVIRADNVTGIVDVVSPLKDGKNTYNEAIDKYFTQLYVRYREGYSENLAEEYYSMVGIMSGETEQTRYYDWFNPKTSNFSPLKVYGSTGKVRVTIKSTSFIKPNVALVRYLREIERTGSDRTLTSHWAATITFKYSGAPMSESDRSKNPLGFQVVEYRTDPDAILPERPLTPRTQPAGPNGATVFPGQSSVAVPQVSPAN